MYFALNFALVSRLLMFETDVKARDISYALVFVDFLAVLMYFAVFGGFHNNYLGTNNTSQDVLALFLNIACFLSGLLLACYEAYFRAKILSTVWSGIMESRVQSLDTEIIEDIEILNSLGAGSFGEVSTL